MTDDRSIVVVAGPSIATTADALSSRVSGIPLPQAQPINNISYSKQTEFTNEETAEIDKLGESVRHEVRDDAWAASAEKAITGSISNLPSITSKDSTVLCGSISCLFSMRIPNDASDSNKLAAIEAIERNNIVDGLSGSLFTSRMYSEKQADGSFIIRALIIRS